MPLKKFDIVSLTILLLSPISFASSEGARLTTTDTPPPIPGSCASIPLPNCRPSFTYVNDATEFLSTALEKINKPHYFQAGNYVKCDAELHENISTIVGAGPLGDTSLNVTAEYLCPDKVGEIGAEWKLISYTASLSSMGEVGSSNSSAAFTGFEEKSFRTVLIDESAQIKNGEPHSLESHYVEVKKSGTWKLNYSSFFSIAEHEKRGKCSENVVSTRFDKFDYQDPSVIIYKTRGRSDRVFCTQTGLMKHEEEKESAEFSSVFPGKLLEHSITAESSGKNDYSRYIREIHHQEFGDGVISLTTEQNRNNNSSILELNWKRTFIMLMNTVYATLTHAYLDRTRQLPLSIADKDALLARIHEDDSIEETLGMEFGPTVGKIVSEADLH